MSNFTVCFADLGRVCEENGGWFLFQTTREHCLFPDVLEISEFLSASRRMFKHRGEKVSFLTVDDETITDTSSLLSQISDSDLSKKPTGWEGEIFVLGIRVKMSDAREYEDDHHAQFEYLQSLLPLVLLSGMRHTYSGDAYKSASNKYSSLTMRIADVDGSILREAPTPNRLQLLVGHPYLSGLGAFRVDVVNLLAENRLVSDLGVPSIGEDETPCAVKLLQGPHAHEGAGIINFNPSHVVDPTWDADGNTFDAFGMSVCYPKVAPSTALATILIYNHPDTGLGLALLDGLRPSLSLSGQTLTYGSGSKHKTEFITKSEAGCRADSGHVDAGAGAGAGAGAEPKSGSGATTSAELVRDRTRDMLARCKTVPENYECCSEDTDGSIVAINPFAVVGDELCLSGLWALVNSEGRGNNPKAARANMEFSGVFLQSRKAGLNFSKRDGHALMLLASYHGERLEQITRYGLTG